MFVFVGLEAGLFFFSSGSFFGIYFRGVFGGDRPWFFLPPSLPAAPRQPWLEWAAVLPPCGHSAVQAASRPPSWEWRVAVSLDLLKKATKMAGNLKLPPSPTNRAACTEHRRQRSPGGIFCGVSSAPDTGCGLCGGMVRRVSAAC